MEKLSLVKLNSDRHDNNPIICEARQEQGYQYGKRFYRWKSSELEFLFIDEMPSNPNHCVVVEKTTGKCIFGLPTSAFTKITKEQDNG